MFAAPHEQTVFTALVANESEMVGIRTPDMPTLRLVVLTLKEYQNVVEIDFSFATAWYLPSSKCVMEQRPLKDIDQQ